MTSIKLPVQRTLYLVRHGELAVKDHLAGHTDFLLSEQGWQQLVEATQHFHHIDLCLSSPLKRCGDFARHFCQQQDIPLTFAEALKEMDFGDFDGKAYAQLWQMDKTDGICMGDFWQNPWLQALPNGETMQAFCERVQLWWQNYLTNITASNTLVFTHAGVIKQLIANILAISMPSVSHLHSLEIAYASVIKVSVYTDEEGKSWPKIIL